MNALIFQQRRDLVAEGRVITRLSFSPKNPVPSRVAFDAKSVIVATIAATEKPRAIRPWSEVARMSVPGRQGLPGTQRNSVKSAPKITFDLPNIGRLSATCQMASPAAILPSVSPICVNMTAVYHNTSLTETVSGATLKLAPRSTEGWLIVYKRTDLLLSRFLIGCILHGRKIGGLPPRDLAKKSEENEMFQS
ncbi:hypothetical protein J6590_017738 [Homalodisca vitripennis]|nr:hypothetical protein J6590_017738 [Homalodisca vitripennis]